MGGIGGAAIADEEDELQDALVHTAAFLLRMIEQEVSTQSAA
jgi:hypothetical protein